MFGTVRILAVNRSGIMGLSNAILEKQKVNICLLKYFQIGQDNLILSRDFFI